MTDVPAGARLPVGVAQTAFAIRDLTLEDAVDRRHQIRGDGVG